MKKTKKLILVSTFRNGVLVKIERKFPIGYADGTEKVAKLQAEMTCAENESLRFEIVDRF